MTSNTLRNVTGNSEVEVLNGLSNALLTVSLASNGGGRTPLRGFPGVTAVTERGERYFLLPVSGRVAGVLSEEDEMGLVPYWLYRCKATRVVWFWFAARSWAAEERRAGRL